MLTRTTFRIPRDSSATRRFRAILTMIALVLAALGAPACSADDPDVQSHAAQTPTYVTLLPKPASVQVGATISFTGKIYSPDGTQTALGSDLAGAVMPTWASGNPAVATVDSNGVATGVSAGACTITVTLADGVTVGTATLTVTAIPLTNLTAVPPTASVPVGTKQSFTINALFADGTSADLTKGVVWSTSDPTIATVDAVKGTIDAIKPGTVTITATDPTTGKTATAQLTIVALTLKSLAVSPAPVTIPVPAKQAFHALGTYSDGTTFDITNSVAWSSDTAAALTIDPASGVGTAIAQGTATVTAKDATSGLSATAKVTVASLTGLAVTPPTASVPLSYVVALDAMGAFSDGSMRDVSNSVVWTSASPTVATVDGAGNVTTLSTGTAVITATDPSSGNAASATITITQPVLIGITLQATPISDLSPRHGRGPVPLYITPTVSIAMGGPGDNLTVTGTYSDGSYSTLDPSTYTLAASPTGIVNLAGTAIGPAAQGFTTITATSNADATISGSINFVVTPPVLTGIQVSLNTEGNTIPYGPTTTTQVYAQGFYSDGSSNDITASVTWSSGTPANIAITASGLASGLLGNTSATITATDPTTGIQGSTQLNVAPAPLTTIAVSPASQSVTAGSIASFTAMGTFADGSTADVTDTLNWTSSDTTVAANPTYVTGNPTGVTSPRAPTGKPFAAVKKPATPTAPSSPATSQTFQAGGPITITATDPVTSVSGTATLTVTAATLASLTPTTPLNPLYSGLTGFPLGVTGTNSSGGTVPFAGLPPLTWSITSGTGATIDASTGVLTTSNTTAAVTTIVVNVLEPVSGATGSVSINIDPRTIVGIDVEPGETFLDESGPTGDPPTQQMSASLVLSDMSEVDVSSLVTWSVSDPANSTISTSGLFTLTATTTSCAPPATITVTATFSSAAISGTKTIQWSYSEC